MLLVTFQSKTCPSVATCSPTPPQTFPIQGIGQAPLSRVSTGPEDRSMAERCIFAFHSVPPIQTLIENAMLQVLLTQDYALIHTERMHDSRIVPLDNRPVLPAHVKQFYGSSASPIFE